MDSGILDGNFQPPPRVPLDGVCSLSLPTGGGGITGICRATKEECEGGTFILDLSGLNLPEGMVSTDEPLDLSAADCEEGLVCCLSDTLCESFDALSFGDFVESTVCVEAGSCDGFEVPFGCPTGQGCCSVINMEAGMPFLDAGQQ